MPHRCGAAARRFRPTNTPVVIHDVEDAIRHIVAIVYLRQLREDAFQRGLAHEFAKAFNGVVRHHLAVAQDQHRGADLFDNLQNMGTIQDDFSLAGQRKIILYSSHVLEVVEKICSTVLILRNGEVVAYDSIERLRELMSQPSLEGVFAQLAQVDDGDAVANRIADAMSYRGSRQAGPPLGPPAPPVAAGLRLYRGLANAFPDEFNNDYGEELLRAGEDSIEPVWRRHGVLGLGRLLLGMG